jgi:hypothetical protein
VGSKVFGIVSEEIRVIIVRESIDYLPNDDWLFVGEDLVKI